MGEKWLYEAVLTGECDNTLGSSGLVGWVPMNVSGACLGKGSACTTGLGAKGEKGF